MGPDHQREHLRLIFGAALRAVDPYRAVSLYSDVILSHFRREGYRRLVVAAIGKASVPMARAIRDSAGDAVEEGVVITKYGHAGNFSNDHQAVFEAGHPLPDEHGVQATAELVRMLEAAGKETLVLCLLSGGGSALLVSPCEGITLAEKQHATDLLLRSGADIAALNAVRKHLSRVKGGRLAGAACPAGVLSLILSDVVGDRIDVIASGPTAPDGTTFGDALDVIRDYGLSEVMPPKVMDVLVEGERGRCPETPKADDPVFERVENIIVGSNRRAIDAAATKAGLLGYSSVIISDALQCDVRAAAERLAEKALKIKRSISKGSRICLIAGGETTVSVTGKGKGGRNTELALAFGIQIGGSDGIALLSAGTDGTDGPTDAAGAFADGSLPNRSAALGLDAGEYLRENDSYTFFSKTGDLFITGPTGTNVMDLQLILVRG